MLIWLAIHSGHHFPDPKPSHNTTVFSRPYSQLCYSVASDSLSSVCLSVTLCTVAKWCVLEQTLLLRAYRKSYMRNLLVPKWMTLTFRDRIKVTSTIALHLTLNMSDTVEIEGWFQRTTNMKWHMGYRMVTWPMTSRDLKRSISWP